MAGLQAPLSTLRLAPRGALRMTRGHSGLLFLSCQRLSLFTLCRSPGALAYDFFRFVSGPQIVALISSPGLPKERACNFNKLPMDPKETFDKRVKPATYANVGIISLTHPL